GLGWMYLGVLRAHLAMVCGRRQPGGRRGARHDRNHRVESERPRGGCCQPAGADRSLLTRQCGEIRTNASSDSSMPAMPTIVSQAVQVRSVCETLRPSKAFTTQKPHAG